MKWFVVMGLMALAAMAYPGCSGSGDDPDDGDAPAASGKNATFSVTTTGSRAVTLSGPAISYSKGAAAPGWVLHLVTEQHETVTIASESGTRPSPGTYTIIDDTARSGPTPDGQYIATVNLVSGGAFVAVSGELVISFSSASEVRGSFTLEGAEIGGQGDRITVEGTFTTTNKSL